MPNNQIFEYVLYGIAGLLVVVAILQVLLLLHKDKALRKSVASVEESQKTLSGELAQAVTEGRTLSQEFSDKFAELMKLMVPASTVTRAIDEKLTKVREAVEQKLDAAGEKTVAIASGQRQDSAAAIAETKEAILAILDKQIQYQSKTFAHSLDANAQMQKAQIDKIVADLTRSIEANRAEVDARMQRIQAEIAVVARFQHATRAFGAALAEESHGGAVGNGEAVHNLRNPMQSS